MDAKYKYAHYLTEPANIAFSYKENPIFVYIILKHEHINVKSIYIYILLNI